jgi:cytosine/adenosine deaminase-related metal-dependent hydrolase
LAENFDSGIHIHVAEDKFDQKHCLEKYNKTVVERLKEFGALESSKTILAHCLHISKIEREILRKSETFVVQNSESNLNNKVGFFDGNKIEKSIMIGTDGMHSDVLRSAKSAYFVGKKFENIEFPDVYRRFRNVHKYIAKNNFLGDADNNFVVLNYNSPTEINESNFLSHFIFGIESKHIEHVISSGKLIIKDRKSTLVDEDKIRNFSIEMGKKLWKSL